MLYQFQKCHQERFIIFIWKKDIFIMHNKEYKLKLEDKIIVYFKELNYIIEIKNEARMYLWYKEKLDKNIN